ncbi:hypothetical protein GCK72_021713 [Caenorhabditis remanei]|uniref:F-box domain-containing protein n=1 Tax=Caenorhabditis remanei TaxID=31234 RepID=A0A6A5GKA6_CAERE|nr:hypothetical protein GCK72_021713 [Caenorhabditis remanei]KAF1755144.1 hypothetical protein GCK72_021713 [Caenorhabditis remanei]
MHKIPTDLLKNCANYLKSCILYEVLSKKPIFDCYRHFCERNGEDAMGYGDFEYYYYRFYSGVVDFEHERRIDSKEKTLSGLPLEILGMVTGYLEPEERQAFDNKWTPDVFRLYINEMGFEYKSDNGRFIRNGNPDEGLETAFNRFAQVLKHPKLRIDRLDLILPDDLFPEEREQLLKCFSHSLHVKTAEIQGSVEETLTIVSHLKPGVLKKVLVTGCPKKLAPVFELEHWKKAEHTELFSCKTTSRSFPRFYSVRSFSLFVKSMELNHLHLLIAKYMAVTRVLNWFFSWNYKPNEDNLDANEQLTAEEEEIQEPKPLTLYTLPITAFEHILEQLTVHERRRLREVSRTLKDEIGYQPMRGDLSILQWNEKENEGYRIRLNQQRLTIMKRGDCCYKEMKLENGREEWVEMEGEDLVEILIAEMKLILVNPKLQLEELDISIHNDATREKFLKQFDSLLSSLPHQLHVERLDLPFLEDIEIQILSEMKPGILLALNPAIFRLRVEKDMMNKIMETQQFKMLRKLNIEMENLPDTSKLVNLRDITLRVTTITKGDMIIIKHALLSSTSRIKSLCIMTKKRSIEYFDILEILGIPREEENQERERRKKRKSTKIVIFSRQMHTAPDHFVFLTAGPS